jgi:hypothetical protein
MTISVTYDVTCDEPDCRVGITYEGPKPEPFEVMHRLAEVCGWFHVDEVFFCPRHASRPALPPSEPAEPEADDPLQAEVLIEWHPSASVGETEAVRHLVEGWCGVLMERLQELGVVDPTVELDMAGAVLASRDPA